ncbi:MAG: ABC transporter substrate-binding protein [Acidimicrobiia bacterium]|nr:ABC transporter substrate-binding protein [Acidimicrobiia bacterium]
MMKDLRRHRWLVLLLSLLLIAAACGRDSDDDPDDAGGDTGTEDTADGGDGDGGETVDPDPGITDDTVTIGASYPLSGPASAYSVISEGVEACFAGINAEGGIEMGDGVTRQVEYIITDDGYAPDQAVANAQRLVEQDEVFMILNPLGTPNNTAIRGYMNEQEVPQAFVASGASTWGAMAEEFPWTIGWQPAYPTEAAIYGEFVKQEFPDGATVAVLHQNDDYGEDYVAGFEEAIAGSNIEIIETQTYEVTDPTVDSQMAILADSGADIFFNVTTPKFAALAITAVGTSDWEPLHLLNSVSNSTASVLTPAGVENAEGVYSSTYLKDPADPQWADDEAMIEYKALAEEHGDFTVDDPFGVYGFSVCHTTRGVLESMEQPTRQAFMDAARNLDVQLPLALPGIVAITGEGDAFPLESMQLQQFNDGGWELVGDVISYEGNTPIPGE